MSMVFRLCIMKLVVVGLGSSPLTSRVVVPLRVAVGLDSNPSTSHVVVPLSLVPRCVCVYKHTGG